MTPSRVRPLGLLAGLILGAVYLGVRFGSLHGIGETVDHSPGLMQDFSKYFYRTGKSLMAGTGPVGGFLYPPAFGLLMMPFSLLSPADSQLLWGILEGLFTLGLAAISARLAPPRLGWVILVSAATVISAPVLHNFKWGQIGVPLTVLGLWAVELCGRRRPLAVFLVSLTASIKLYPGVLFGIFARRRDWKAMVGGVLVCALLILGAPGLVLGIKRTRKFFAKVAPFLSATADSADPNSQSLSHWLTRTVDAPPEGLVVGLALLVALVTTSLLWGARVQDAQTLDRFTAFLSLSWIPFVVPTCWANYFAFLPPFAAFLASQGDDLRTVPARRVVHLVAGVVLMATSFIAVDVWSGWATYVRDGVLLLTDLLAMATALGLLAAWTWKSRHVEIVPLSASDRVGNLLEA